MSAGPDREVERALAGARPEEPAAAALDALRGLGAAFAPAPGAALAALLATGVTPAHAPDQLEAVLATLPAGELARRNRVGRIVASVVVAGGVTVALTGVAAANNDLPEPAQSVVTAVLEELTPFHAQRPAAAHPGHAPGAQPEPALPTGRHLHLTLGTPTAQAEGSGPAAPHRTGAPAAPAGAHRAAAHRAGRLPAEQAVQVGQPFATAHHAPAPHHTDHGKGHHGKHHPAKHHHKKHPKAGSHHKRHHGAHRAADRPHQVTSPPAPARPITPPAAARPLTPPAPAPAPATSTAPTTHVDVPVQQTPVPTTAAGPTLAG